MKPYVKKLTNPKGDYRLFFKDQYGNLYGGIKSFKTWEACLKYGIKHLKEKLQCQLNHARLYQCRLCASMVSEMYC